MANVHIRSVKKRFGEVEVLHGVSIDIPDGSFTVLVGPSGCGKSTLLRMVAGLEDISDGEVEIAGRVVNHVPPKERDIAMVFQNYALYPHMTVRDNMAFSLMLAKKSKAFIAERVGNAAAILGLAPLLERFPRLRERYSQQAGTLSGGEQQMMVIGRALMTKPRMLLLDEPSLGIAPKLVQDIARSIVAISRDEKVSVLLVEQNSRMALSISKRTYALATGKVVLTGESKALMGDERIKAAYLGGELE